MLVMSNAQITTDASEPSTIAGHTPHPIATVSQMFRVATVNLACLYHTVILCPLLL